MYTSAKGFAKPFAGRFRRGGTPPDTTVEEKVARGPFFLQSQPPDGAGFFYIVRKL